VARAAAEARQIADLSWVQFEVRFVRIRGQHSLRPTRAPQRIPDADTWGDPAK
jgi:hypothetical protein